MNLLELRSNLTAIPFELGIPFAVYTVGTENQPLMTRLEGFSANQWFLTFSGTGSFRFLGEDNWSLVPPGTLLYIPSGLPHEYGPHGSDPWIIGYVTFMEQADGFLAHLGCGNQFFRAELQDVNRPYELLSAIWQHSGPQYNAWRTSEHFFAFCLEIKKQTKAGNSDKPTADSAQTARYPHSVVHHATRYMQDHLQRNITVAELSAHVGYSSKQLTRLFRESLDTTPLQYLQRIRLQAAALLLEQHPHMTIRQTAAHVGMEPVYFTRLFRRMFGVVPSKLRASK
ncbi:AraC-like DNA-binding protein [Paenibacillus castaneae]|uniref:AraC family transcriptional regulator n=1 Tax=Paenibacillus castaneae TaxID=474957 RepID=UPI000C9AF764|nr:AraC family transcriptional regulator [Paenibacillus castaneae]NIK78586.1 AraC-like DNA-binding protein [Paenibacillus castaneae]